MPVVPVEMAKDNKLKITEVDSDEPDIQTYDGKSLKLVGQTKMFLRIKGSHSIKLVHAIVVSGAAAQEILLSWQEMIAWGILGPNFPYPPDINRCNKMMDKEEKETSLIDTVIKESIGSSRTQINLNLLDEDKYETAEYRKKEKQCQELRSKLLREFKDVFKEVLDREDIMKIPDIKIYV